MEFCQANQGRVKLAGSSLWNDSCMNPVPASVFINILKQVFISSSLLLFPIPFVNGINGNEVWLYEVVNGTHCWSNVDINTGEEIWKFFKKFVK